MTRLLEQRVLKLSMNVQPFATLRPMVANLVKCSYLTLEQIHVAWETLPQMQEQPWRKGQLLSTSRNVKL